MIVVGGVWMIATDVVLGLVAVAVFPILIVLNVVYQHRVDRHYSEAQDELGALSAGVHESFEGVQLIKAYGAEARETERLSTIAGRIRDARIRAVRLRGTFEAPSSDPVDGQRRARGARAPPVERRSTSPSDSCRASSTCSRCWCSRCG
jgi:ABC-type multidrug transport system fused ATPase/permease subunit